MSVAQAAVALLLTLSSMQYIGDYTVSAYNYYEGGGENYYTAGGYEPTPYYTVATSSEFPFGTILYIEDIGEVQVQDRGGYMIESGQWIDIHIGYDSIESWDMREREVYIVRKE